MPNGKIFQFDVCVCWSR